MLSVLIPTYQYNVVALVGALHRQLEQGNILFEIICFDNGSKSLTKLENEEINKMASCVFKSLPNNLGRSKIRNSLADKAKYPWLLFLDADVLPVSENFIQNYISSIHKKQRVVYGGLKYEAQRPLDGKLLRWMYGKRREEISFEKRNKNPDGHFSSANFLIDKEVFKSFRFDEELTEYGHEDTLLGLDLVHNDIKITQIDNPVYHLGLDPNKEFIKKTRFAVQNLLKLYKQGKITKENNRLLKKFNECNRFKMKRLLAYFFNRGRGFMERNLESEHPSLFVYDLYKLTYLCAITVN